MSSDLISRSALMSHIESERRKWGEDYDAEQILGDIEDFQTAYDVDRVVKQLNEKLEELEAISKDMVLSEEQKRQNYGYNVAMNHAIEAVKGGGVDE